MLLDCKAEIKGIVVTESKNPFVPSETDIHRDAIPGETISDWLDRRYAGFTEFELPTICQYNGDALLRKEWPETHLKNGDMVNFVTIPGAELGVSAIIAIVSAVISIAVSIYMYVTMPKPNTGDTKQDTPPVYSLAGQQNKVRLMLPIEGAYGRVRLWPSIAARSWTKYQDNDQYLYQLFCLGQGKYEIHGVYVEDTPSTSFDGFEYEVTGPGGSVTLFPDNVVTSAEAGGQEIFAPNEDEYTGWIGPYVANASGTDTNRIEIDLLMPKGFGEVDSDGDVGAQRIAVTTEYMEIDDSGAEIGSWTTLAVFDKTMETTTPQRFTIGSDLTAGRYKVRVKRTDTKDLAVSALHDVKWGAMRAFLPNTRDYGDVTMLAIKAKATNQLNRNTNNRISVEATRQIPTYNTGTETWSSEVSTGSIVWAFCDIFRSDYGGGMSDTYLDLDSLAALDAIYTTRNEEISWTFDQRGTVWDAAKTVARVGRAIPMMVGSKITMIRDAAVTTPVAMFTPRNIVKNSFRWEVKCREPNEKDSVDIEYVDPTTWKQEEISCVLPGKAGAYPEKIVLAGCADRDHAYHEGMYIASRNEYIRDLITFETGLEGHLPTFGDLIAISHDVPRWGQSGYVVALDGVTVTLSEPVTFELGTHYIVLRGKDGSVDGPYEATAGSDSYEVITTSVIDPSQYYFDDIHERPIFQFGLSDEWSFLAKVANLQPSDGERVRISAEPYDSRVYDHDSDSAPALVPGTTPDGIPSSPEVSGLGVRTIFWGEGWVRIYWSEALGTTWYKGEYSMDNINWSFLFLTVGGLYHDTNDLSGYVYLRVAAIGNFQGPWDTWEGDIGSVSGVPFDIGSVSLQEPFVGTECKIEWTSVIDAEKYRVRVYQDEGSTLMRTTDTTVTSYSYTLEMANIDGTPNRDLQFQVVGVNANGESANPTALDVLNPPCPTPTGMASLFASDTTTTETYQVGWDDDVSVDFDGYKVWGDYNKGFEVSSGYSGNDSNTVVLLHFEGEDGSTTITDDAIGSTHGKSLTASGDAALDVSDKVFGNSALLLDGVGDHVYAGDSVDYQFGSGAFCIEARAYLDETFGSNKRAIASYGGTYFGWNGSSGIEWMLFVYNDGTVQFQYADGTTTPYTLSASQSLTGWNHYVVACNGTNIYLFVNGSLVDSDVFGGVIHMGSMTTPRLRIGAAPGTPGDYDWIGLIDEVRVSKGSARIDDSGDPLYISSGTPADGFTVPAQRYGSSNTGTSHYTGTTSQTTITFNKAVKALDVEDITNASQAVVTITGHGVSDTDQLTFADVGGMTEVNGNTYDIVSVTTDTITINVDSSTFGAYTSGGTATTTDKYPQKYYWRVASLDKWDDNDYNISSEQSIN